jgi:hypothetical protein
MRFYLRISLLVFFLLAGIAPVFAQETCTVSTNRANHARLRQGPATDQAVVGYLPANTPFQPIERFNGTRRQVWYRLVPEQVVPGVAVAEVWVGSPAVTVAGNCDAVPLRNPPAQPASGGDTSGGNTTAPAATLPQAGRWTFTLDANTIASCQGTETITIPSVELWGDANLMTFRGRLRETGNIFTIDGQTFNPWENNQFNGSLSLGGQDSVQLILRVDSRTQMSGMLIITFYRDGVGCSSTTNVTAVRTGR